MAESVVVSQRAGGLPRVLRLVLAGLPATLIATIAISFWLLSVVRGDPYRILPVSSTAPEFDLPTVAGGRVTLEQHLGRHPFLLFFNEGIGCGPCWDQIVDLEKDARFKSMDIELISVMVDPLDDLRAEAEARGITTIVAADVKLRASRDYGALGKSMHPGVKPGHTFILVNRSGTIIWRWDWDEDKGPMYLPVNALDDEIVKVLQTWGR